jgi:TPR repeat protein
MTTRHARIITLVTVVVLGLALLSTPIDAQVGVVDIRAWVERGDADAQLLLRVLYAEAEELEEAQAQAAAEAEELEERRARAEGGDVFEQFFLGLMLRLGRPFPKDEVEAAHWLRRAADQGMASAQYALGILLRSNSASEPLHTSPIPPERLERMSIREQMQIEDELEHAEAIRWFRSAADGGYPDALSALAYAYFYGEPGVPQDYVQAYVWGSIAANNLNPGSERDVSTELRDEAASSLTVDERTGGDRLVQEWSEAHETRYNLPGMPPPPPPR